MAKFQVFRDTVGEYRWRIKANNGETVCVSSEGYVAKQGALESVQFVKANAPVAPVEDLTVAVAR